MCAHARVCFPREIEGERKRKWNWEIMEDSREKERGRLPHLDCLQRSDC